MRESVSFRGAAGRLALGAWIVLVALTTRVSAQTDGTVDGFTTISGLDSGDRFGADVAVIGDLNSDSVPDLAVGAPFADVVSPAAGNVGEVEIVLMNAIGTVSSRSTVTGASLDAVNGVDPNPLGADDLFGTDVTALGDLDSNGSPDFAVGSPQDDDGGSNRGAIYIIFTTNSPSPGTVLSYSKISTVDLTSSTFANNAFFGQSVELLGDIGGTSDPEIAVGARGFNSGRGAVFFFSISATTGAKTGTEVKLEPSDLGLTLGVDSDFGQSLALLGDIGGSSDIELAIGIDRDDVLCTGAPPDGSDTDNGGSVSIVSVNSSLVATSFSRIGEGLGSGSFSFPILCGDSIGFDVAAMGDLDGDSNTDLLIGAPFDDGPAGGGANEGAFWVTFLDGSGEPISANRISQNVNGFTGGLTGNDRFGEGLALGDLDNDGVMEVFSGAPLDGTGTIYVIFMNQPPVCSFTGADDAECNGSTTVLNLDASSSMDPDPNGGTLTYAWSASGCGGPGFSSTNTVTTTFELDSSAESSSCTIILDVTDDEGATTSCSQDVDVVDMTAPVITLNGSSSMTLECSVDSYSEPGAMVSDACDTGVSVVVGGDTVDTSTAAVYVVTYNATDASSNPAVEVTRTVTVEDTTAPVITLNGMASMTLQCGVDSYSESGASVSDACDSGVSVVVGGDTVDTSTAAVYVVTYNATDASSNPAVEVTRTVTVEDTTAPVITLNGMASMTLQCGVDSYSELGANASDGCDPSVSVVVGGDTVDTSMAGTYVVTYDATDASSNPAVQVTRTVMVEDGTAPVITLNGLSSMTLECGVDSYSEMGASASDGCDPSVSVVVGGDTVDPMMLGTYVVTYDATDASGNPAVQVTRTVMVEDTTAPVITLNGMASMTLQCGVDIYSESGANASDVCDPSVSVVVGGDTVDTSMAGTYVVTYDATDASSNPAVQVTRTVMVEDGTAPVITLNGSSSMTLQCGVDSYVEPGAMVSDTCDATVSVVVGGDAVDTSMVGTYVVTYDAMDASGNPALQVTRTVMVEDTTAPVITLNGSSPVMLECGVDSYAEMGASASDACDASVSVVVGGDTVDTSMAGTYVVTYDAMDASSNPALQVTRTVMVEDTTAPEITLTGVTPMTLECNVDSYVEPGALVSDACDATVMVVVGGDVVDPTTPGTYVVTYNAMDASSNPAVEVTRTVDVVDTVLPTAVCQDITVGVPASGSVTILPADVDGGSTDSCGVASLSLNQDTFLTADIGSTVTVTLTVEDADGNMDTCEALVTVGADIGSGGGAASFDPGGGVEVSLDVPAGAVPDSTVFTVTGATAPAECEAGLSVVGVGSWDIVSSSALSMPVDVTVFWTDANNDGIVDTTVIPETSLRVCHDGVTVTGLCTVEPVGGPLPDCDTAANTFEFQVSTFSQFTLYTGTGGAVECDSGGPYPPTECLGVSTPVLLDGSASSAGVTYLWTANPECTATFDDATLEMPTLTFIQPEDCDVTLTVTVSGGVDMAACVPQTVSVVDGTIPVTTILGDNPMTLECGDDFVDPGATASDVCEGDLTLFIVTTGTVDTTTPGTYLLDYDVSDGTGNSAATVTRTVEVMDTGVPTIALLGDNPLVLECGGAYVEPGASATDACDDDSTLTGAIVIDSSAVDPTTPGDYMVTYDVMDSSANPAVQVVRTVMVADTTPPSITSPAQVNPTNLICSWVPAPGALEVGQVVTDNCSLVGNVQITNDAPSSFPLGNTTVTWMATDEAGNTGTSTQLITVTDETLPFIGCTGLVRSTNVGCTFETTDGVISLLGEGVVATDNCTDSSQIVLTNDAQAFYGLGTFMINWTATDQSGNSAMCQQALTVIDGTPPALTCPPDITRGANSGMTWVPSPGDLGMAVATDNCPGAVTVINDAPAIFPLGETLVSWTATDLAGNLAICTQTVTVQDAMAPEITCPVSLTTESNASTPEGACIFVGAFGMPTVTDDDSDESEIVVMNDAPGGFPLGETVVTWTATDPAGNSSSCQQVVAVVDLTPPLLICPPVVNASCTTVDGATVDLTVTVSDNCDPAPTVEFTPPADTVFPPGLTDVTVVATDASGNTSSCLFTVSVVCGGFVVPGDCNQDGVVDLSDALCEVNFLFLGSLDELPCGDGSGADIGNRLLLSWLDDETIDLSDVIALLQWKFLTGPEHFLGVSCRPIPGCPATCSEGPPSR